MDFFVSHLPAIFIGAVIVAVFAAAWQILSMKNAENRRKRMTGTRKKKTDSGQNK